MHYDPWELLVVFICRKPCDVSFKMALFSVFLYIYCKWLLNVELTFALWLNLLSSHFTANLPPKGINGFLAMSVEQMSSRLRKTWQARLLFAFIMRDVCFRLWSIDQKYIISRSSPRATFACWAKKLLVLKLRFFLHPLHLLQQTKIIYCLHTRMDWMHASQLKKSERESVLESAKLKSIVAINIYHWTPSMWFPSRVTSAMPWLQAPQCNGLARRPRFIIHCIVLEVDPSFIDVKNARSIWCLGFFLLRALKIRESMN